MPLCHGGNATSRGSTIGKSSSLGNRWGDVPIWGTGSFRGFTCETLLWGEFLGQWGAKRRKWSYTKLDYEWQKEILFFRLRDGYLKKLVWYEKKSNSMTWYHSTYYVCLFFCIIFYKKSYFDMGVSLNGGTLITHPKCWSLLVGKSMVVGETHHFRGNPHMHWYKQLTSGPSIHLARWNGSRKRWMEENSLIARYIKDRALPWQLGWHFFLTEHFEGFMWGWNTGPICFRFPRDMFSSTL